MVAARQKADNVIHVHSVQEYNSILQGSGDKLVVVDFSAVWYVILSIIPKYGASISSYHFLSYRCGPCRMIAPKYAQLSKEHEDVVFLHVDIDNLNVRRNARGAFFSLRERCVSLFI